MIKEQDDTVLIQNILSGNQQAQKKLYEKYKKLVYKFLRAKYNTYYDLEDDVSEIMIKVFFSLDTFDETKSKFRSWVFSIAKNYMIDKWRSNSYTTTLVLNEVPINTLIDCVNVSTNDNSYITSGNFNNFAFTSNINITTSNSDFENCNSLSYISEQLSPVDYMLLNMKYVQGYNYDEIGMEFNATSTTISNRVNYIKTKLKKNNSEIIYD